MILSKPFDNGQLVEFNSTDGTVSFSTNASGKPKGNFHLLDQKCLALYCEDSILILQIGCDKWELSSESMELRYFHNMPKGTTCFEVNSKEKSILLEYKAWWSEIPGFEPIEPEMDEDEDFLGYVFAVWKNKQLQKSLVNNWV